MRVELLLTIWPVAASIQTWRTTRTDCGNQEPVQHRFKDLAQLKGKLAQRVCRKEIVVRYHRGNRRLARRPEEGAEDAPDNDKCEDGSEIRRKDKAEHDQRPGEIRGDHQSLARQTVGPDS